MSYPTISPTNDPEIYNKIQSLSTVKMSIIIPGKNYNGTLSGDWPYYVSNINYLIKETKKYAFATGYEPSVYKDNILSRYIIKENNLLEKDKYLQTDTPASKEDYRVIIDGNSIIEVPFNCKMDTLTPPELTIKRVWYEGNDKRDETKKCFGEWSDDRTRVIYKHLSRDFDINELSYFTVTLIKENYSESARNSNLEKDVSFYFRSAPQSSEYYTDIDMVYLKKNTNDNPQISLLNINSPVISDSTYNSEGINSCGFANNFIKNTDITLTNQNNLDYILEPIEDTKWPLANGGAYNSFSEHIKLEEYQNNMNDTNDFDFHWIRGYDSDKKNFGISRPFKVKFTNLSGISGLDIGIIGYVDPLIENATDSNILLNAIFKGDCIYLLNEKSANKESYLFVDENQYLTLNAYGYRTNIFYITLENNFNTKYGDDFVLNFKSKSFKKGPIILLNPVEDNDKTLYSFYDKTKGFLATDKIDSFYYFFAIFDQLLIYEAEMYINEGNGDYNGVNNNNTPINSWTNRYGNGSVYNSVAYVYGGKDSIAHFNADLNEQKIVLNHYIINGLGGYTKNAKGWTSTLAPPNKTTPYSGGQGLWSNYIGSPADITINGKVYHPYRPVAPNTEAGISSNYAGIDCAGFVQRCALHRDAFKAYASEWNERKVYSDGPGWYGHSRLAVDFNNDTYTTGFGTNTNAAIPGDVLSRNVTTDGHVVIIRNIVFNGNTREIDPNSTTVIEAVIDDWRVQKSNTWGGSYSNYLLRRIK